MKILLYLVLIIFFYRVLTRLISLSSPKENLNQSKNRQGIKYQDAEFKEID